MSTIIKDMYKKILLTAFILINTFLFSQEMKLYAPFPSRINVETIGPNVVITWKDSVDVEEGNYEIYRAESPLTADNLYLAEKIGESASDVGVYEDQPPMDTDFYYAVFARDSEQVYKICIPYRNVTTSPVSVQKSDIEETKSTVISELETEVIDDEVYITFQSSDTERNVLIFRSNSPILTYESLTSSVLVGEIAGELKLTDKPLAGLEYYYAAIDGDLYRSGNQKLLYLGNYTISPVPIRFSHEINEDNRFVKSAMPLPLLKITEDLKSGEKLEERKEQETDQTISDKSLELVRKLYNKSEPAYRSLSKITLAYNKNINPIVTSYFAASQWEICVSELEKYTTDHYDDETNTQSHFYRGQAYFFSRQYNEALLEFIMVENELYVETKDFLDAIYEVLRSTS